MDTGVACGFREVHRSPRSDLLHALNLGSKASPTPPVRVGAHRPATIVLAFGATEAGRQPLWRFRTTASPLRRAHHRCTRGMQPTQERPDHWGGLPSAPSQVRALEPDRTPFVAQLGHASVFGTRRRISGRLARLGRRPRSDGSQRNRPARRWSRWPARRNPARNAGTGRCRHPDWSRS